MSIAIRKQILKIALELQIKPPTSSPTIYKALDKNPSITKAYNSSEIIDIEMATQLLNSSLHYLSGGSLSLEKLRQQNFSSDFSKQFSPLNHFLGLTILFYNNVLSNNGQDFTTKLTKEQKIQKYDALINSTFFQNIPQGGINEALQQKIGSFKETFRNLIQNMKSKAAI